MNNKLIALLTLITLMSFGCATNTQVSGVAYKPSKCPMPSGFKLEKAIETAETSLTGCPDQLDRIFQKLLDIAKHKPAKENSISIQLMLKNLIKKNAISERYAKELYKKYFSISFISIPDIKSYQLKDEMNSIHRSLKDELDQKKIGMVDCCADRENFKKAESEYIRIVNFLSDLVLNEEYLKGKKENWN